MKKIIVLTLVFLLTLSLSACDIFTGDGNNSTGTSKPANSDNPTGGNESTTQPPESSKPPATSQPSSGRILSAEEKKLVGTWGSEWDGFNVYYFNDDGTFTQYCAYFAPVNSGLDRKAQGNFSFKNGVLSLTMQWCTATDTDGFYWEPWGEWETSEYDIVGFGTNDDGKQYIEIGMSKYPAMGGKFIRDRIGYSLP